MRVDAMQEKPYTVEGDETVLEMDATTAKLELAALTRLRAQCDACFAAIIVDENITQAVLDQTVILNKQMETMHSRGEAALQRHLNSLTIEPAANQAVADNTAQLLQIVRKREPKTGKFNGEPYLWPAFRDLFESEVHNRDDLEPVAKLTFLKAACVGKAATALGLWSHTNESYEGAWALMQKRYNDSYKIKQGLINMLFDLPACTVETHDGLSHLVDTISSVLRQLANIQIEVEQWDTWLIALIIRRLPIATIDAWEQRRGNDGNPTLADMLEFIGARARGRLYHEQNTAKSERSTANPVRGNETATSSPSNAKTERPLKRRQTDKTDQPRAKRLAYDRNNDRQNRRDSNPFRNGKARRNDRESNTGNTQPVCLLCKRDHWIHKCPKYLELPIKRRNELMDQWGHCRVCFRQHAAGECRWTGCNRCTGNHHLINCPVTDKKINALLAAHRNAPQSVPEEASA